ncbi:hypothetical protein IBTHAUMO2_1070002 [Nitrosopumilaceae archaeon]|nr:hypothetical protein [Nitrosopumilus sp.]CAI9830727.1 hypothetical protein IBTHAUMO2_1070002 [Nitrosopumilaceae archaeon]MDA7942322.1 hypothetical protein [Nitrosopumilus sp.]MDA7943892.1 hypothetical protein [Nitrosopumilus sp.]MDA7945250.1 hypothetical protein [Nitrosopumilus sp.]
MADLDYDESFKNGCTAAETKKFGEAADWFDRMLGLGPEAPGCSITRADVSPGLGGAPRPYGIVT